MKPEELFYEIGATIRNVKPGKMFGSSCLKLSNGKSAAMIWRDSVVVKLSPVDIEKAQKIKGATFFEPMEGRKMKEWVQIPFSQSSQWEKWIKKSVAFVLSASNSKKEKK